MQERAFPLMPTEANGRPIHQVTDALNMDLADLLMIYFKKGKLEFDEALSVFNLFWKTSLQAPYDWTHFQEYFFFEDGFEFKNAECIQLAWDNAITRRR